MPPLLTSTDHRGGGAQSAGLSPVLRQIRFRSDRLRTEASKGGSRQAHHKSKKKPNQNKAKTVTGPKRKRLKTEKKITVNWSTRSSDAPSTRSMAYALSPGTATVAPHSGASGVDGWWNAFHSVRCPACLLVWAFPGHLVGRGRCNRIWFKLRIPW